MGVKAIDPQSSKIADIDVQKVTYQNAAVVAIECKGKEPGGILQKVEVEEWLRKTGTMRAHYREHPEFREAKVTFELWTSGTIHADALDLLESEKARRTKTEINWKDGKAVLELAKAGKEKSITDALKEHFMQHPLSKVESELAAPHTQ